MDVDLPVEERLVRALDHFGVRDAHVFACRPEDWEGLAARHSDRVTSLALVCPPGVDTTAAAPVASRLLVITGDGAAAARTRESVTSLPGAELVTLRDYAALGWSDVIADRRDEVGAALVAHLRRTAPQRDRTVITIPEGNGHITGLSYAVRGAGPPLLLLPLGLAPSQWEPLIAELSKHYCTIVLGGPALGMVALLEKRGHTSYWHVVRSLIDVVELRPGETLLEVGCGSGVLLRRLARHTSGANPLIGVDISPYLLREALALVRHEGLDAAITFREGDAEALPFPDGSVDVSMACTVLEEGDADRMLAELVRVTKPGGRVAVIVRSNDMSWWVNASLPFTVKTRLEAPSAGKGSGVAARGCADATIYARCRAAGLTDLNVFVQFQSVTPAEPRLAGFERQLEAMLTAEEIEPWRRAVAQAKSDGTFFIAMPLHCAVGTKPR